MEVLKSSSSQPGRYGQDETCGTSKGGRKNRQEALEYCQGFKANSNVRNNKPQLAPPHQHNEHKSLRG